MGQPRARWFDAGNLASGFFVIGNVVTGVIAIGNVARGFIAIGNVAVGVFAFGNVAVGVVSGGGATIALGLLAAGGVLSVPVLKGFAGVTNVAAASPLLGLIPIIVWSIASGVLPGKRAPRPGPALTEPDALLRGEASEGWIRARAERAGDRIRLRHGRGTLEAPASPEALGALGALEALGPRPKVVALVRAEERVRPHEGGYREAGERERVLVCAGLEAAPPPVPPWINQGELQWWLARAWRAGAVVGLLGLAVKLALAFILR